MSKIQYRIQDSFDIDKSMTIGEVEIMIKTLNLVGPDVKIIFNCADSMAVAYMTRTLKVSNFAFDYDIRSTKNVRK